jgi:hypothetical protein
VNQPCPITQDEDTGHGNLAGHVTYDNAFRHRIYKGGSPKPLARSKSETNGLLTAWLLFGDYVTESSAAEVYRPHSRPTSRPSLDFQGRFCFCGCLSDHQSPSGRQLAGRSKETQPVKTAA